MSRLIVFEGIEGSGKTTQARKLVEYLESRKIPVVYTKEPGGTDIGAKIRALLLDPSNEMHHFTELFLYMADRAEHVGWIKEQLKQGVNVVCDRMFLSTLAYQGYGRGLSLDLIEQLNKVAMQTLAPDLTYLIDISPAIALERVCQRGRLDRIEKESMNFHQKVHRGFLDMAMKHDAVAIIQGDMPEDQVFQMVRQTFDHWVFRERFVRC